jgi:septal ring factor EnvC (AmiA/AmiB activator)
MPVKAKLVAYVVGALLVSAALFTAGYRWRMASEVTQARQETRVVKAQVKQDGAEQRQQAERLSDQLAEAQLKSLELERRLQAMQQKTKALQQEVAHAHFDAVPVPSIAGTCPDPFSGRVFERLYNGAAQAVPPH